MQCPISIEMLYQKRLYIYFFIAEQMDENIIELLSIAIFLVVMQCHANVSI
jgi:hypothetical protein